MAAQILSKVVCGWFSDWLKPELGYIFTYRDCIANLRKGIERLGAGQYNLAGVMRQAQLDGIDAQALKYLHELDGNINKTANEGRELIEENSVVKTHCWHFIGDCNCINRNSVAKKATNLVTDIGKLTDEIKEHTNKAQLRPMPPSLANTLAVGYVDLDSRKPYLTKLRDTFLTDEKKQVIGVYGEKDAGKTMLVEKFAKDMYSGQKFKHIILVPSGKNMTEDGIHKIQQQIAESIGFEMNLQNVVTRKGRVSERLTEFGETVLIIIDNVDENFEFNKISIPIDPLKKDGCRVVVVARSLQVLTNLDIQGPLEVKPLSDDERRILKGKQVLEKPTEHAEEFKKEPNVASSSNSNEAKPMPATTSIVGWESDTSPNMTIMIPADELHIANVGEEYKKWRFYTNTSTYRR